MAVHLVSDIREFSCLHDSGISTLEIQDILENFSVRSDAADIHNTGRGAVFFGSILKGGSPRAIVVRKGLRGGFLSRSYVPNSLLSLDVKSSFLLLPKIFPGKTRMWEEFRVHSILREQGVRVPEPAFAAVRKRKCCWYEGYFASYAVPKAINLLDHALKQENESLDEESSVQAESTIREYSFEAGIQAKRMLQAGVFHTDLHIGNVLVSPAGVYIIDFDKAKKISTEEKSCQRYAAALLERWDRSIVKRIHSQKLKPALIDGFRGGLLCL